MSSASGETRQELLKLARNNGYTVSGPQLARWHREGLLPEPQVRYLGKGQGTQTVYPPGTGDQLLALCAIRAKRWRLGPIAWHLWWLGYEVSVERIREFIGSAIEKWDRQAQDLIDPVTGLLSEKAQRLAEKAKDERLSQPLSGARRRVGKERFGIFISLVLEALSGSFEGFISEPTGNLQEDERRIVEKGLGLDRTSAKHLEEAGLWQEIDVEDYLKDIGWLASKDSLSQELGSLTDEQLLTARDESRSWLAMLAGYDGLFDEMLGRGSLGLFSMLGELVPHMEAEEQALWTLVWAIGRNRGPSELQEGLEAHGKPTAEMEAGLRDWQLVEKARKEVPEIAEVLTPQRIQEALVSPQELERLAKELEEVSREVTRNGENQE